MKISDIYRKYQKYKKISKISDIFDIFENIAIFSIPGANAMYII